MFREGGGGTRGLGSGGAATPPGIESFSEIKRSFLNGSTDKKNDCVSILACNYCKKVDRLQYNTNIN